MTSKLRAAALSLLLLPLLWGARAPESLADFRAEDMFGRSLGGKTPLQLVDWQGFLANPAIEFDLLIPESIAFPARVVVKAKEPRLYFTLPSSAGPDGPRKEFEIPEAGSYPIVMSVFPDRDGKDERYALTAELTDRKGKQWELEIPIEVLDQDTVREPSYPITVDFSQDQTNFYRDKKKRSVVQQAASDWTAFFDGTGLSPVPAKAEQTFIWKKEGFTGGHTVRNQDPYTGYLLYAYGIETDELRAGGEGSIQGGFQVVERGELPLRRSGGMQIDTRGNFNELGWLVELEASEWWKATNLGDVANDLYSIAHHEIGHALLFNRAYPKLVQAKEIGAMSTPALFAYLGKAPEIDTHDHLHGTIDPITRRGAYGYEYYGEMPHGRWLITPTDLLFAEAIGYTLLPHPATMPLRVETTTLPESRPGRPYRAQLQAAGGVPIYRWALSEDSNLPAGLRLDADSGEITGKPRGRGDYEFQIRVQDPSRNHSGAMGTVKLTIS